MATSPPDGRATSSGGLGERLTFLLGYLRDRKAVGSITPSSAGLSRHIARVAGASRRRAIAELGAGTGPITAALLEALPRDARLCAFEIDPDFVAHLRARFVDPRLSVVDRSANDAAAVAAENGVGAFDAVVSAIPFSLLGRDATRGMLRDVARSMAPGAPFVALQYHPTYLPPLLAECIGPVERTYYPWNLPPAMVLRATRPK